MTPQRGRYGHEDEDEDWDWDADDDADPSDDSDEEPTVPCPYCRREMLEDAPQCPSCGRFISAEDHPDPGKPLWIIATAVVCLVAAVWWVLTAFSSRAPLLTTKDEWMEVATSLPSLPTTGRRGALAS